MLDIHLLQRFLATRDERAFADLVQRYVDLVYSAARRQTQSAELAEEITQQVFVTLAQKATSIRQGEALAGWLLVTTRFVALNALRTEARRRHHEREAAAMKPQSESHDNPDWQAVTGLLDEAVAKLKREDRDALALRFFQGRSIADVGAALGISAEAAQKRVSRAVQRLRDIFAARGVATSEDALGSLLSANALIAAPAALKAALSTHALSSAATATTTSLATSKGLVTLMAAANTKILAAGAVVVLLVGVTGTIAYQSLRAPGGGARQVKVDPVAQVAQPVRLAPPMAEDQWLPRFKAVYSLKPGENVKFVPPPFIPERIGFYRREFGESQYQAIPAGPDIIGIEDDGTSLHEIRGMFGGPPSVTDGAEYVLGIKSWDLRGADKLIHLQMRGDWVVRKGTSRDQRIAGFLDEVGKANRGKVTMLRQEVPREAVIIRGTFAMKPILPAKPGQPNPVVFYRGKLDPKRVGYGGGSMADRIASICDMPVIDEAGVPDKQIEVHTAGGNSISSKLPEAQRQQQVDELLANLAKQTSFEFKRETRVLPVWNVASGATTGPLP